MISLFRREVAENCALLGYYAASSGNFFYHYLVRNSPEERSLQAESSQRKHYMFTYTFVDIHKHLFIS